MSDSEFVDKLSKTESPFLQLDIICTEFERFDGAKTESQAISNYNLYLEYFGIAIAVCENGGIEFADIDFGGDKAENIVSIKQIFAYLKSISVKNASRIQADTVKDRYTTLLGAGFVYEFSDGDVSRIQQLINELRELISGSNKLEDDHQRRLLAKLEKLQSELHKKVSDLDRCWGLIGEAGVVSGKLGRDAKPIVDRIREIAEIVWRTQARSEQLPSASEFPLLERKDREDDD